MYALISYTSFYRDKNLREEEGGCYIPMTLHRSFWRDLYVTHSMMINTFSQADLLLLLLFLGGGGGKLINRTQY
jgi:hypothetical protein